MWRLPTLRSDLPAPVPHDIYDPKFVRDVFDRCSEQYIAFSTIFSFGFTERWRRQCVAALPELLNRSSSGYDLMAGTGEAWPHLLKRFPGIVEITAVDISSGMHAPRHGASARPQSSPHPVC